MAANLVSVTRRLPLEWLVERISRLFACLAFVVVMGCGGGEDEGSPPETLVLPISPVIQQTSVWCWAASAQMVLGHLGYPFVNAASPQCGIVGAFFGSQCAFNCFSCQTAIGPMSNEQLVVNGYGTFLTNLGLGFFSPATSTLVFNPLSLGDVVNEISNGRPIIVGIAPQGGWALPNASQHIAVLVGYDISNGRSNVVVNDPFPFFLTPSQPNPYIFAGATQTGNGQYTMPYTTLVVAMRWANTIFQIRRAF